MLTKDLLRVTRRGGGYQPLFVDESQQSLAARVIGCYQGHVGQTRAELDDALERIERESDDFKLVRGFAKLLDRDATWGVRAPISPGRAREVVFGVSEQVDVVTEDDRQEAIERAANRLDVSPDALEESLYADLESREVLVEFDPRWDPAQLCGQYNLSLAQTALFDATEVRIRTADPKTLVSMVKRLRLLYEVRQLPPDSRRTVADADREVVVTGPDALFSQTRRYGTRFARLLRSVAKASEWRLEATIDDRGTERELVVTDEDMSVPGVEPITEVSYDSDVEESFARRFESLDLEWDLVREPDPLPAGEHVIIPDFAFDWQHSDFRVYFEIMGFWTPEYVEKKLDRLASVSEVELLVAVDESLGVGEDIEARDHRAIPYSGAVDVGDVRRTLRQYEKRLIEEATSELPDEIRPDEDVVRLESVAEEFGVSVGALDDVSFPEHERIGRALVRPSVLQALDSELELGMDLEAVTEHCEEYGIDDRSAALAGLGYKIAWEGLDEGYLQRQSE